MAQKKERNQILLVRDYELYEHSAEADMAPRIEPNQIYAIGGIEARLSFENLQTHRRTDAECLHEDITA